MSASTLVKDFIWRICNALNDFDPQFVYWSETEIVMAINDGQAAILKYIPTACQRFDSMKLAQKCLQTIKHIPAANLVAADGSSIPSAGIDGRQLLHVDCNSSSSGGELTAVRITDRYDLDTSDPDWMTRTGTSVKQYVYSAVTPMNFYVSPAPSGANQWVRIAYTAYPVKITAGGAPGSQIYLFSGTNPDLLSIDDANVDDLFNYVTARLNMKDIAQSKPQMVSFATNAFLASINAQATALTGLNPNIKHLPMMTGMAGGEPISADRT